MIRAEDVPTNNTRWAIEMITIPTRERETLPVRAMVGNEAVTEDMVAADVRRLNETSGLDGSAKELAKGQRSLGFRLVHLQ